MTTTTTPAGVYEWKNKMGNRDRAAWLLFIVNGNVVPFAGESISGVCRVLNSNYVKNGRWSHYIYRMRLGENVRPVAGLNGWNNNTFVEGLATSLGGGPIDTWADLAERLEITVEATQSFLRAWRPKAAEALDEADLPI